VPPPWLRRLLERLKLHMGPFEGAAIHAEPVSRAGARLCRRLGGADVPKSHRRPPRAPAGGCCCVRGVPGPADVFLNVKMALFTLQWR